MASTVLAGTAAMVALPGDGLFESRADAGITAAYVPDVESILNSRSPGQRRYGWLVNNKPKRLAFSAEGPPSERVLPATRRRPINGVGATVVPDVPLTSLGILPNAAGSSSEPSDSIAPGSFGGVNALGGAPIIGGITSPGSGGGDGGDDDTPSNPVTPTPETPVTAVPEPASWAMLVLGFAALGTFMRRRRLVSIAVTAR